jgi:hypothetical protein
MAENRTEVDVPELFESKGLARSGSKKCRVRLWREMPAVSVHDSG